MDDRAPGDLPTFDMPVDMPNPEPPKKPRAKPMKRSRGRPKGKVKVKVPKVAKRKRRVVKVPIQQHAGGRYTRKVYDAIGAMMMLTPDEREVAFEVSQELSK